MYLCPYICERGDDKLKLFKNFRICLLSLLMIISLTQFVGCENVKHVEALEGYTQTGEELVEEANLVLIDGFYAGTGTLNDIVHVRFQAQKDTNASDTIDVTNKFFKIIYTDDPASTDKNLASMEGKVKAFKRTYSNGTTETTHFYYELYSSKNQINDCGDLSSD